MSHNTESVMSSAVSVSGVESLLDDASTVSVENRTGMSRSSANELFDLGDDDLHIIVNGKTLETHKFLIKRFANLKGRIKNGAVTLEAGGPEAEDFSNTFNILYASVIEGPCNFDQTTLISALLVATRYDYPALRTFAISKLEKAELSAVERIRLARKFNIPSWEEPAFLELCERDEAITMSEAEVLGLETIVHLGRIREKEQRRRGKEVDAAEELKNEPKAQADGPEVIETPNTPVKIEYAAPNVAPSSLDNAKTTEGEGIEITAGTALKPCFIYFPPPSAQILNSSYAYGSSLTCQAANAQPIVHFANASSLPAPYPPSSTSRPNS
ncbi:hypothetical protein BDV93DRAFT_546945 [Ceratobasidium sp. AG-I]|nr:hypothetical protein BDV93DRAFT_546945 [Ceratobasidium sp. AG-I]